MMGYSAVIRTKNSDSTIENCLRCLLKQTIKPDKILIVDSGSSDNTLQIVNKFPVYIIHYPFGKEFNYSKALNLGINQTSSTHILSLSSHVYLENDYSIELMIDYLIRDELCASVSLTRSENIADCKTNFEEVNSTKIYCENWEGRGMFNFCSLFSKNNWKKRKFDESIPRCEDQIWIYEFLKEGFYSVILLTPKVYYNNPYYNFKKDAWDLIVLGETVYPYFLSNNYIRSLFKNFYKNLINRKYKSANYVLGLIYTLTKYRYISKIEIRSVYNKSLK